MIYSRLNISILLQVILIAAVGILFTETYRMEYMSMTTIGLILTWTGQVIYLNYYVNRTNRDVRRFLDALRNQDTSLFFSNSSRGRYFRDLCESFNEITRDFRLVRIEKEAESMFYKEIARQSASGIVAVADDNEVRFVNNTALEILGLEKLENLSDLKEDNRSIYYLFNVPEKQYNYDSGLQIGGMQVRVAVKVSGITLDGNPVKIYSLLDISRELARGELEAWQKLIRVLNHEITNSVSPISILSSSLLDFFQKGDMAKKPVEIDQKIMDDTILGLKTIMKRSQGLSDFINNYRSFTNAGKPEFIKIGVKGMLDNVLLLLSDEIKTCGAFVKTEVNPGDISVNADEKLIEQTLINILKNSLAAIKDTVNPSIIIRAKRFKESVTIEIEDNGRGIPEEIIASVFTPFFTTRKDGSGIGLSLARQVMQIHNGSINLQSEVGEYTKVLLTF